MFLYIYSSYCVEHTVELWAMLTTNQTFDLTIDQKHLSKSKAVFSILCPLLLLLCLFLCTLRHLPYLHLHRPVIIPAPQASISNVKGLVLSTRSMSLSNTLSSKCYYTLLRFVINPNKLACVIECISLFIWMFLILSPYLLSHSLNTPGFDVPTCEVNRTILMRKYYLPGDFSSSAEFFIAVGVLSFLYCTAILVVYVGYWNVYRESKQGPVIVSLLKCVMKFIKWNLY